MRSRFWSDSAISNSNGSMIFAEVSILKSVAFLNDVYQMNYSLYWINMIKWIYNCILKNHDDDAEFDLHSS